MALVNVILSGGVGSRLWPLSRKSRPKQYIPLFEGKTLFQLCVERNYALVDKMIIVGNADNYQLSRGNLKDINIDRYEEIIEATPRNTSASIAFAAFNVDREDILLITPSDHIISNIKSYAETVQKAIQLASNNYLATFGCTPTRPETGYGYIEFDQQFKVLSFKEKPDEVTALKYVRSGNFLWNSGMFCVKAGVYLQELKKYSSEIYETALKAWNARINEFLSLKESEFIPAISVDYAVIEHSNLLKVIPFDFDWNDLGSFDALWEYLEKTDEHVSLQQNLVLGTKKHVEFIGLENTILVDTEDAILVMNRNSSQEVKKVYERLEIERPDLLD